MQRVTRIGGTFSRRANAEALREGLGGTWESMSRIGEVPPSAGTMSKNRSRRRHRLKHLQGLNNTRSQPGAVHDQLPRFGPDGGAGCASSRGLARSSKTDTSEFGKFGWVMDPEGNRIELWEPPADRFPG